MQNTKETRISLLAGGIAGIMLPGTSGTRFAGSLWGMD